MQIMVECYRRSERTRSGLLVQQLRGNDDVPEVFEEPGIVRPAYARVDSALRVEFVLALNSAPEASWVSYRAGTVYPGYWSVVLRVDSKRLWKSIADLGLEGGKASRRE